MDLSPSPPNSSASSPSSALAAATCRLAGRVIYAVATCVFASGSVVGAATGCVVGMSTESGMLRGAGVGAISGAVVSVEVAEAWRDIWRSGDSGVLWTILYVVDIVSSLLSGGLVQEKVGLAVQSAVERQISAISSPFGETIDLYETGGARGIPAEALRRLPEMEIAAEDDTAGAGAADCSVCLQDFRVGETARMLPGCRHVFHAPCIDCWLVRHGSCPLCRRDI